MNIQSGLQRLKIVWLLICYLPAILIIVLLQFSEYRPELMKVFSLLTWFIATSLAVPVFVGASFKTIVAIAIAGGLGGAACFINLNDGQHMFAGDAKPIIFVSLGAFTWIALAAIQWVIKGFRNAS